MQKLYEEAEILAANAKQIANELFGYNPSLKRADKRPLPVIAESIGHLMYRFAALRIDIVNKEKDKC